MVTHHSRHQRGDSSHARRRGFTLFGLLLLITLCCLVLALVVALREAASNGSLVLDLMIAPDGNTVAAVFGDDHVLFFDVPTGEETGAFTPRRGERRGAPFFRYALSPDGRYLARAACSFDGNGPPAQGLIWDVVEQKEHRRFGPIDVRELVFSPDGRKLAALLDDGTAELVDVTTGGRTPLQPGAPGSVIYAICFSPEGNRMAVASTGPAPGVVVEFLDAGDYTLQDSFTVPGVWLTGLEFSPDGKKLVGFASIVGANGQVSFTLRAWDSSTHELRGEARMEYPESIAFTGDGRVAVLTPMDGRAALFDGDTLKPVGAFTGLRAHKVASAPAAHMWVTTDGASIELRDSRTGLPIKTLWHSRPTLSLPLVMAGLVAWALVFSVYRRRTRAKTQSASCVWCGDAPSDRTQPAFVCSACRAKQATAAEQRALQRRGMVILALLWIGGGGLAAMGGHLQVALFVWCGAPAALSLLLLLIYRRNLARFRRRMRPSAGLGPDTTGLRQWEVDPRGNVSSMHAPYDAFAEMARASARRARDHVKVMSGVDLEFPAGLKVVDFPDFDELVRRMAMFQTDASIFACVYVARPGRQIICCQPGVRRQLGVPSDRLCGAFTNALVDHRHVLRVPTWLSASVAHWSGMQGRADESQRLHRVISAYLAEGGLLGPEIFGLRAKDLAAHMRQTYNHQEFVYAHRFLAQSLSIVEYLATGAAPAARKDAFRAMVADMVTGKPTRALVPRKYGMPEEELLAGWQAWVRGRDVAAHSAPSDAQRQVLVEELLPLARDRQARRVERLRAIRTLGKGGFPLGADALIEVVDDRNEDYLLRQTAGWALGMISGRHDRGWHEVDWHAWWAEVPETWKIGAPATV